MIKSILVALWPLEKPFNLRITEHAVLYVLDQTDLYINLGPDTQNFTVSLTNSCFLYSAYGSIVHRAVSHSCFFHKSVRNLRQLGVSLNRLRNISDNVNMGSSRAHLSYNSLLHKYHCNIVYFEY